MTELEYVKGILTAGGYHFLLCRGEIVYTGEGDTTAELLETVRLQEDWQDGYCAAEVFGKADALLCVLLGLSGVYASLMSKSALRVLEKHGIADLSRPSRLSAISTIRRKRSHIFLCHKMQAKILQIRKKYDKIAL